MNTFSHILLGNILYDYVREEYGIQLDKASFILGNVLPDYNVSMLTRPHYIDESLEYLRRKIKKLTGVRLSPGRVGKKYSRRIGAVCHYCSDFFCYAHSAQFSLGRTEHIRYESRLHRYLLSKLRIIEQVKLLANREVCRNTESLDAVFNALNADYNSVTPSPGKDLICTLRACALVIVSLMSCCEQSNFRVPVAISA